MSNMEDSNEFTLKINPIEIEIKMKFMLRKTRILPKTYFQFKSLYNWVTLTRQTTVNEMVNYILLYVIHIKKSYEDISGTESWVINSKDQFNSLNRWLQIWIHEMSETVLCERSSRKCSICTQVMKENSIFWSTHSFFRIEIFIGLLFHQKLIFSTVILVHIDPHRSTVFTCKRVEFPNKMKRNHHTFSDCVVPLLYEIHAAWDKGKWKQKITHMRITLRLTLCDLNRNLSISPVKCLCTRNFHSPINVVSTDAHSIQPKM